MRPGEIWRTAARARALGGLPRWRQLAEIALLRLTEGKLQPDEYFSYRLFCRGHPFAEKRKFLGYWRWDAIYAPNDPRDAAVANSKLRSYELFAREGLPHPRLRAVINGETDYPGCVRLAAPAAVADFLRSAPFPLFIKPNDASHGWGAKLIERLDGDMLHMRDGSRMPLDALAAEIASPANGPVLVQDVIHPHPSIARMTGGTAATARVFVLLLDGEAVVHRAVLRIPVGHAMVDNFEAGRTGNLIAEIDADSGVCGAAVGGIGFDYKLLDHHLDTGQAIRGTVVPGWGEVPDVLKRASSHFPGLKVQAWDVAFTQAGPTLIEVNAKGEFRILQHATQRGLIDWNFRRTTRI